MNTCIAQSITITNSDSINFIEFYKDPYGKWWITDYSANMRTLTGDIYSHMSRDAFCDAVEIMIHDANLESPLENNVYFTIYGPYSKDGKTTLFEFANIWRFAHKENSL